MRSLGNHFEDYPYVAEQFPPEEIGYPTYEIESSCYGDREYLSDSHSKMARRYSSHHDYSDDVCTSYEEPDMDDLVAYWHEQEGLE